MASSVASNTSTPASDPDFNPRNEIESDGSGNRRVVGDNYIRNTSHAVEVFTGGRHVHVSVLDTLRRALYRLQPYNLRPRTGNGGRAIQEEDNDYDSDGI